MGDRAASSDVSGVSGVPDYSVVPLRQVESSAILVIPVINEGDRILGQLDRIRRAEPDVSVVVADGGSTDGSMDPAVLRDLGVSTLLVKTGPGRLSAQLRMGIHYALTEGADHVLTMDGNGKDDVEGIDVILRAMRSGADFVQGSRFVAGGVAENTPWARLLAITLVHAPVVSLAAGHRYTDTTNGFRGHSRALLTDPRVAPLRDVFVTYELLAYLPIRAARLGYRVEEVPVARRYPRSAATPTKIHGARGNYELLRILWSAARGAYDPSADDVRAERARWGS